MSENIFKNLQTDFLDINTITPNPYQPRKVYNDADIASLSVSIKKHGLLQPVMVTTRDNGFELVYGHRRLLAAKMAGMDKILAVIQPAGGDLLEPAVVENTQRQDLSPLDESAAFQILSIERSYNLKELSTVTGKSVSSLSEILKLNIIPADVQDKCRHNDHLTLRFLIDLSKFGDEIAIRNAYQYYLEFGKLPKRTHRVYGNKNKLKSFLDKLSHVISEFNELDIDDQADEHFLQQVKDQLELFNKLLRQSLCFFDSSISTRRNVRSIRS